MPKKCLPNKTVSIVQHPLLCVRVCVCVCVCEVKHLEEIMGTPVSICKRERGRGGVQKVYSPVQFLEEGL